MYSSGCDDWIDGVKCKILYKWHLVSNLRRQSNEILDLTLNPTSVRNVI